jgi:hypothetical protein
VQVKVHISRAAQAIVQVGEDRGALVDRQGAIQDGVGQRGTVELLHDHVWTLGGIDDRHWITALAHRIHQFGLGRNVGPVTIAS